jgi:glycosyltransferase involved in cell wall biosynthesis
MRVVHLNTMASRGGAAQAAGRLHRELLRQGMDSKLRVQFEASAEQSGVSGPAGKIAKAAALLRDVSAMLPLLPYRRSADDVFSADLLPSRTARDVRALAPDLVHLHWTNAGFVPIHLLPRLRRPLVWTLHDMWPLTGGCHHARDCTGYQSDCGHCPVLNSRHTWDLSRAVLKWKARCWRDLDIHLVAPSRWMAAAAGRSRLFRDAPVSVIPNGVDLATYRPWDRALARDILRLPAGPLVLFSAAKGLSTPYKGGDTAAQAMAALRSAGHDATLVVMGGGADAERPKLPVPVHWLGQLHDDTSRALAYAAADVCLSCSSEDNLPSAVSESLACGTPVVAYAVGGVPDMLDDGINGYLVPHGDFAGLVRGMAAALDAGQALAGAARQKAEQVFDIRRVAMAHTQLYEALLAR